MSEKIKVGIMGGSGYTGIELLRLLIPHTGVSIQCITSRKEAGVRLDDVYPNLRGKTDLVFTAPEEGVFVDCDLVFFATPNGIAMKHAPSLLADGIKVIDLSADFRLKDVSVWEHWYGQRHVSADWISQAIYGLPELNRLQIQKAQLVANPGCYPTAVQLGLYPLLINGLIDESRIIADAKSGASGAGRQASVPNLLAESYDNFKSYGASGHRHLPEIKAGLTQMAGGLPVGLTFVPHLLPMIRGIETTIYAELKEDTISLQEIHQKFEDCFKSEPFVEVLPLGWHSETRSVKSTNVCHIALHRQPDSSTIIVSSVIDNLVKGAAGQAVQNLNIMFSLPENQGLNQIGLLP
jgi:N-acetyl-gamma-glutamyl-phosphate reductase